MKLFDVKDDKESELKYGDQVKISKYKNIFAKGYTLNWSEEAFMVRNIKNTVSCKYVIEDLKDEEVMVAFYEKELQMTNQVEFRIEKVVRRKGHRMNVK